MGRPCAGCSSERFEGKQRRTISVATTIPCIDSISGQANLRVLEVTEIKTVPYLPFSHPFELRGLVRGNGIPHGLHRIFGRDRIFL